MKTRLKMLFGSVFFTGLMLTSPGEAADCTGNCGKTETFFTGTVPPAPTNFGAYDWVSTNGGVAGAGAIAGFSSGATNGSELRSDSFFGSIGQTVSFYFNYITSDGAGFADYSFAQLINTVTGSVANLFTARTQPSGTIAPGLNLPDVEASLTPGTVPILPGAPNWAPLGSSSGACYDAGCGSTGWIKSDYTIAESGTYQLRFGVANWTDTAFDSGLAFSGLVLGDDTIGDGSSFESPLLPSEIEPDGSFNFDFVATPAQPVVVDPDVATGYDFSSDVGILSAQFEDLGDDQYMIQFLNSLGVSTSEFYTPGSIFDFSQFDPDGVFDFTVSGIDTELMLDPTSTTAFKTSLVFNVASPTAVNLSQTPITTFVDGPPTSSVPEPSTWAMIIMGFGLIGASMRRPRTSLQVRFG